MWKLEKTTPKRLPTWVGGTALSPYISNEDTALLDANPAEASYLSSLNFIQLNKLPFLVGFSLVDLGAGGYNNSYSRNPTVDLNACYFLTVGTFPTSRNVTLDFFFTDLNFHTDLSWVNYYPAAIIFIDKDSTPYKVSDLKGLTITERTTIRIRLTFDVFLPFLGIKPYIRSKKLIKVVGANTTANTVKYYGQVYRFDKFLDFSKNTFFKRDGNVYLCP